MNFVKENRVGYFEVNNFIIENHPREVLLLMAKVIVVSAVESGVTPTVEYFAYCEDFDPVSEGGAIPAYRPIFEQVYNRDMSAYTFSVQGFERID